MYRVSKWELFSTLACNGQANIVLQRANGNVVGILQSVQRESGSGNSFNVCLMLNNGKLQTFHVYTTD